MAWTVDYLDIGDLIPFAAHQRRQEAVQAVEIGHRQKHLARKRLEPAAGVAGAVVQDGAADLVGDARLQFLEAGVLAPDPLARGKADTPAAFLYSRNELRQEGRIVLAVAVERGHDRTARCAHAAAHGGRLAG